MSFLAFPILEGWVEGHTAIDNKIFSNEYEGVKKEQTETVCSCDFIFTKFLFQIKSNSVFEKNLQRNHHKYSKMIVTCFDIQMTS